MSQIADRVYVDRALITYVRQLAEASRELEHVRLGLSARGCLALIRVAKTWAAADGRTHVVPQDVVTPGLAGALPPPHPRRGGGVPRRHRRRRHPAADGRRPGAARIGPDHGPIGPAPRPEAAERPAARRATRGRPARWRAPARPRARRRQRHHGRPRRSSSDAGGLGRAPLAGVARVRRRRGRRRRSCSRPRWSWSCSRSPPRGRLRLDPNRVTAGEPAAAEVAVRARVGAAGQPDRPARGRGGDPVAAAAARPARRRAGRDDRGPAAAARRARRRPDRPRPHRPAGAAAPARPLGRGGGAARAAAAHAAAAARPGPDQRPRRGARATTRRAATWPSTPCASTSPATTSGTSTGARRPRPTTLLVRQYVETRRSQATVLARRRRRGVRRRGGVRGGRLGRGVAGGARDARRLRRDAGVRGRARVVPVGRRPARRDLPDHPGPRATSARRARRAAATGGGSSLVVVVTGSQLRPGACSGPPGRSSRPTRCGCWSASTSASAAPSPRSAASGRSCSAGSTTSPRCSPAPGSRREGTPIKQVRTSQQRLVDAVVRARPDHRWSCSASTRRSPDRQYLATGLTGAGVVVLIAMAVTGGRAARGPTSSCSPRRRRYVPVGAVDRLPAVRRGQAADRRRAPRRAHRDADRDRAAADHHPAARPGRVGDGAALRPRLPRRRGLGVARLPHPAHARPRSCRCCWPRRS